MLPPAILSAGIPPAAHPCTPGTSSWAHVVQPEPANDGVAVFRAITGADAPAAQPSSAHLASHPAATTNGGAPDAARPTLRVRRAAVDTGKQGAVPSQVPVAPARSPLTPASLLGARIAAARILLGPDATYEDDAELLDAANRIHAEAATAVGAPAPKSRESDVLTASQVLWEQECMQWAKANGLSLAPADRLARLERYLHAWREVIHPPPAPHFKDRRAIALAYLAESPRKRGTSWIGGRGINAPVSLQDVMDSREVVDRYFRQFSDYIEQHLDIFCTAAARHIGLNAGWSEAELDHRPARIWRTDQATRAPKPNPLAPKGRDLLIWQQREVLGAALVFSLPGGKHGSLGADGALRRHPGPLIGAPSASNFIRAYLPPAAIERARPGSHARPGPAPAVDEAATVADGASDLRVGDVHVEPAQASIRDLLAKTLRTAVLTQITILKQEGYHSSPVERMLRLLLPFYPIWRSWRDDPDFQFAFGDVAIELTGLAICVGIAALTAGGGIAAARAGLAAAQLARAGGQSARVMMAAALRAGAQMVTGRAFTWAVGKQLTDFILPVFSARDMLHVFSQTAHRQTQARLREVLRRLSSASHTGKTATLLANIYDSLAKTTGAELRMSRAEIVSHIKKRAQAPVPRTLYRGHSPILQEGATPFRVTQPALRGLDADDYLVGCILHSARTGGYPGAALSLSEDVTVAARFARGRPDGKVYRINTSHDRANFRTIENILIKDGPRLAAEGRVTPGALRAAARHALVQGEKEVFYVAGTIPAHMVEPL